MSRAIPRCMSLCMVSFVGREAPSIQGVRVRRCLYTANSGLSPGGNGSTRTTSGSVCGGKASDSGSTVLGCTTCNDLITSAALLDYIAVSARIELIIETAVLLTFPENVLGLRLLATFGEAGAARMLPLRSGEVVHLSHLARGSHTQSTIWRGDIRPVPRHRHRDARP